MGGEVEGGRSEVQTGMVLERNGKKEKGKYMYACSEKWEVRKEGKEVKGASEYTQTKAYHTQQ